MDKIIGCHYAEAAEIRNTFTGEPWGTTSIGVCPVLASSKGKPKLGAAVVRITGPNTEEGVATIDRLANIVVTQLNAGVGIYTGPKNLNTDSPYARHVFEVEDHWQDHFARMDKQNARELAMNWPDEALTHI
jgi:hypothetical protein